MYAACAASQAFESFMQTLAAPAAQTRPMTRSRARQLKVKQLVSDDEALAAAERSSVSASQTTDSTASKGKKKPKKPERKTKG